MTKSNGKKPKPFTKRELIVLTFAKTAGKADAPFTMKQLTDQFATWVRARKKKYKDETSNRGRFAASVVARNSIRRLLREKLVRRTKRGQFRITEAGLAA